MQQILQSPSLSPWFTVLMNELVDRQIGVVARVMPATVCTAIDNAKRRYLAKNFNIRKIITLHDPKKPNWSADTDIPESLVVMTRQGNTDTEFISLARYPRKAEDVWQLYECILTRKLGSWGTRCSWPITRIQIGDWSPAVWFHPELANAFREIDDLNSKTGWMRLGDGWPIQTTREIVGKQKWQWCDPHGAIVNVTKGSGESAQTTIAGKIDAWAKPAPEHNSLQTIENLKGKEGLLHIANTQNASSARLFAIVLDTLSVGYAWTPVQQIESNEANAIAVWLNSTLGRIAARRWASRHLSWPLWQPKAIQQIVVPDVRGNSGKKMRRVLANAFQSTQGMEVPQYRDGTCPVREAWDDAVAEATGISRRKISRWAELLHKEPTIAQTAQPQQPPDAA